MPRRPAQQAATNFTSDRHAFYAAWVISELARSGMPVTPVRDEDGNYTNRLTVCPPQGGDNPPKITLMIPPPPESWDLLGGNQAGPVFRGDDTTAT